MIDGKVFKVPAKGWILATIKKMEDEGTSKRADWNRFWLESYTELGGEKQASGRKACPCAAAYGLWMLGRVRGASREFDSSDLVKINDEYGPNTAYVVIAVEELEQNSDIQLSELWPKIRTRYEAEIGKEAASCEAGQVRLTMALHRSNLLTDGRRLNRGTAIRKAK